MKELINLATKIQNEKTISFKEACLKHIKDFEIKLSLSELENELSSWSLKNKLPNQLNVYNGFGQPPVTIFNNGEFVVDLYFWIDNDTSIHSHSFEGVFKLLYGRSVHEVFDVKAIENYDKDIHKSEISLSKIELLEVGDCREIIRGKDFNHRLIHLDAPTVTLCIRTIKDQFEDQWHHFTNGLSVQKIETSQDVLKCLFFYNYLFMRDPQRALDYLRNLIAKWSKSTSLNLYEKLSLDPMGMDEGALDLYFELFLEEYGQTDWFSLYKDFYEELEENYQMVEGDGPKERFLEHALNFNYDKTLTENFLQKLSAK